MGDREPPTTFHPEFLPYTADELRQHFVFSDVDGEDPERHLRRWQKRMAEAPNRDASFLDRDETLWTAGALLAIQRRPDSRARWRTVLASLFGPCPPVNEAVTWDELLAGNLDLFFEVGLPSPPAYREWLSTHLADRHALRSQQMTAETRALSLEGRTQLDAMLLASNSGLAVHFEAKVLSDIDTKTTHDPLRNQLARNIDCLAHAPATEPRLARRDPDRSFLVLLTPEIFRRQWQSRLYGHLLREYASDPAALQRDLPHLSGLRCAQLSRRLGWLTFEDLHAIEPTACPWLVRPDTAG